MFPRCYTLIIFCFLSSIVRSQEGERILSPFIHISSYQLENVQLNKKEKLNLTDKPLSLFIFLSPECPLSKNYTKTLNELQLKFKQQVQLIGIVPGNAYTQKEVAEFINKYKVTYNIYIDPEQKLTHYLKATVTPQVVLLNNKYNQVYTGAIDDWVLSLGKTRLKPTEKYTEDAIEQSLSGTLVKITKTTPIGCKINDF